jgi:hypothetical protein
MTPLKTRNPYRIVAMFSPPIAGLASNVISSDQMTRYLTDLALLTTKLHRNKSSSSLAGDVLVNTEASSSTDPLRISASWFFSIYLAVDRNALPSKNSPSRIRFWCYKFD